jgi:uncharacterized protein YjbI with pentapeptide repeats
MNQEELNEILRLHLMWLCDLRGGRRADLSGADLAGANLCDASLDAADLTGADLTGANLSEADLKGTVLTGTDLWNVNFTKANLTKANLAGADLRMSNLTGANLTGADLSDTDLDGAKLPKGCKFYNTLPRHNIAVIYNVAYIGCRSLSLTDWLVYGPEIGSEENYADEQIDLYMEIIRKEHEARRTE